MTTLIVIQLILAIALVILVLLPGISAVYFAEHATVTLENEPCLQETVNTMYFDFHQF